MVQEDGGWENLYTLLHDRQKRKLLVKLILQGRYKRVVKANGLSRLL